MIKTTLVTVLLLTVGCSDSAQIADPVGTDGGVDAMQVAQDGAPGASSDLSNPPTADLAQAIALPDLSPGADLTPIQCVNPGTFCTVDAQCCSADISAGSCARTQNGIYFECCINTGTNCGDPGSPGCCGGRTCQAWHAGSDVKTCG